MKRKAAYAKRVLTEDNLETKLPSPVYDKAQRSIPSEPLSDNEELFRELVENSPIGISIIQDEKVVYRNPEQQKTFGRLRNKSTPMFEKIHPDDRVKLHDLYLQTLSGNTTGIRIDLKFINLADETAAGTSMKWLQCRSSLIEYKGSKAVLVNMIDITKEREMEHLLRINDRMASLGHVAAGIAHEIRNPLSGINICVDTGLSILEHGYGLEDLKEIFENMQSASAKIETVIKRVLDFSRPSEPRLVPADINTSVEGAIGLSSVMLRKSSIELITSLDEDLPLCPADAQLMEQVVLNLITNAAEAMKTARRKKIEIRTSSVGGSILVSVSDSGPGIPSTLAKKIFDPFFTTKKTSTGIGLSLCTRIIKDHKGTLSVSSGRLGGAEFTFTIPLRQT